jgi:peptidoglycan hydrolase CwlO-like protein
MKMEHSLQKGRFARNLTHRRGFLAKLSGITFAVVAGSASSSVKADNASRTEHIVSSAADDDDRPSFKEYVTQQLDKLVQLTDENGVMQSEIASMRRKMTEIQSQLDNCREQLGSCETIHSVQQTLDEIKRALNIP